MRQNRQLPRKECLAKVRINWQAEGRGYKEFGMIEDKSEGGLGITFPTQIPIGSVVAIIQGFSTSFAVVRHCSRQKSKFFIGVEFCEMAEGTQAPNAYKAALEAQEQEQKRERVYDVTPVPAERNPDPKDHREPPRLGDFAMLEPLQRQR